MRESVTDKKTEELAMDSKKYAADYFVDDVMKIWRERGIVDEKYADGFRSLIYSFEHLLSSYDFEDLLKTLLDVSDLMGEFDWDKYKK